MGFKNIKATCTITDNSSSCRKLNSTESSNNKAR